MLKWYTPKFESTDTARRRQTELCWIFKLHTLAPIGINHSVWFFMNIIWTTMQSVAHSYSFILLNSAWIIKWRKKAWHETSSKVNLADTVEHLFQIISCPCHITSLTKVWPDFAKWAWQLSHPSKLRKKLIFKPRTAGSLYQVLGLTSQCISFNIVHISNIPPLKVKVEVGVLCPVQQPGSYWDRSLALPLVGLKPTQVTACVYMPNLQTTRPLRTYMPPINVV